MSNFSRASPGPHNEVMRRPAHRSWVEVSRSRLVRNFRIIQNTTLSVRGAKFSKWQRVAIIPFLVLQAVLCGDLAAVGRKNAGDMYEIALLDPRLPEGQFERSQLVFIDSDTFCEEYSRRDYHYPFFFRPHDFKDMDPVGESINRAELPPIRGDGGCCFLPLLAGNPLPACGANMRTGCTRRTRRFRA